MRRKLLLSIFFFVTAPLVVAQAECTLQTVSGTYAMYEQGFSLVASLATTTPSWAAPSLIPFGNITEITFDDNGVGEGFYWLWRGALRADIDAAPEHALITELNPDCTGKIEYQVPVPGSTVPATIPERIIVFDEGREIRTVPLTIANGIPTMAWLGEGHRIIKGNGPPTNGGPQMVSGTYIATCQNIVTSPANPAIAVADAFILRLDVGMNGDFTGQIFEKMGPASIEGHSVWGRFDVNPNCSINGTLLFDGIPGTILTRGVLFDGGKQLYITGVYNIGKPADQQGLKYSMCHGTRAGL